MYCEFCNKTFSSISSLNYHKLNTKYCLKLQGKEIENTKEYNCEYCDKMFSYKQTLEGHVKVCNMKENKKENEELNKSNTEQAKIIKDYEQENEYLKDQLYKKDIEIVELKTSISFYKESHNSLKEIIEFNNKKTTAEIDDIYTKKRLSLDIQSYLDKEVLYIFEFTPDTQYMENTSLLKDANIHYFEFGITSNIRQRQTQYGPRYRLDNAFAYGSRLKLSLAEKYVKNLVCDMGLKFNYRNKLECMFGTYKELEDIYKFIIEHNSKSKNNEKTEADINEFAFEIEKLQTQKEIENVRNTTEVEKEKLKHKSELIKMMKDGILSFEQFKECLSY